MILKWNITDSIGRFQELIREVASVAGVNSLMVLSCDENGYKPETIDAVIQEVTLPLSGGIFPSLIADNRLLTTGNIVIGLSEATCPVLIEDLSNGRKDYETLMDETFPEVSPARTMMVFVDGFSKRINAFIESLFMVFGLGINYVGGGAGSLSSMEMSPCLYTNDGLKTDSAVLVPLSLGSGIGVSHGWDPLEGPFRVTESDRNVIRSLDWQPAFDLYREIVAGHTGRDRFDGDDFFDVSKAYPFGITRMGKELIVRDPVQKGPDNSLVCVGEVPEGSFVSILNGNPGSLITAAGNALKMGQHALAGDKTPGFHLVMDCISRVLFLEDQFNREIQALQSPGIPMLGACSIGEIANCGREFIEFYNKTCVVAVMEG